ncbi:hypothetical protein BOX15_Mlig029988g2, partial [Macrostomum lignano]
NSSPPFLFAIPQSPGDILQLHPIKRMSARQLFDAFDADKSGSLDKQEFAALVRAFTSDQPDAKIAELMKEVDKDGNGKIEFGEFEPVANKTFAPLPDLKFLADYRALDTDGNGLLGKEEIAQLATKLGKSVDPAKLAAADKDGDGNLNYLEFVALMQ